MIVISQPPSLIPLFKKYDDTYDPTLHLSHYKLKMMFVSVSEADKDVELKPNTITHLLFAFAKLFITHFASYRKTRK